MFPKNKRNFSEPHTEFDDNEINLEPQKHKKISKDEQIYGIFGNYENEPEPEKNEKLVIEKPLSFVKSKKESEFKISHKLKIYHDDNELENTEKINQGEPHENQEKLSPKDEIEKRAAKFSFSLQNKRRAKPFVRDFGIHTSDEVLEDSKKNKEQKKVEQIYKETYGKGHNILKNLGYSTGEKLGKTIEGIAEPIIPQKRPEKLGLNFGGFKEHSNQEKLQSKDLFMNEAENNEQLPKAWKKTMDPEKIEEKRIHRAEQNEIKREYAQYKKELELARVNRNLVTQQKPMTIIDMTGPAYSVISDISELKGTGILKKEENEIEVQKYTGKLKSYVKLYLGQCRYAKQNILASIEESTNNTQNYEYEQNVLQKDINFAQKELTEYKAFLEMFAESSKKWLNAENLQDIFKTCIELFEFSHSLYEECNLPELSANIIMKYARKELTKWRIGFEDKKYFDMLREIQEFFNKTVPQPAGEEEENMRINFGVFSAEDSLQKSMIYFLLILEDSWIPSVVSYINNEWDPKDPDILLLFVKKWSEIVPKEVMLLLYEMNIAPRIKFAVESWDPYTDQIPIHIWIHPWLPILGLPALNPAITEFSEKISKALTNWSPNDESAKILLEPWKKVMSEKDWSLLMRKCIIPKLAYSIKELEINPANQNIVPLQKLFDWINLVDTIDIIQIMKDFFFPKWVQTLEKWIAKKPNKKEVYVWYTGWKDFIPKIITEEATIQRYFSEALKLIQQLLTNQ